MRYFTITFNNDERLRIEVPAFFPVAAIREAEARIRRRERVKYSLTCTDIVEGKEFHK